MADASKLPGPGLEAPVDVDGDAVSTHGDRYVFNYWLELGGSLEKALAAAVVKGSGTIDLSDFFASDDALLAPQSTLEEASPGGGAQALSGSCETIAKLHAPFGDASDPNNCPPASIFAECNREEFRFATGLDMDPTLELDPSQGLWCSRAKAGMGDAYSGVVRLCLSDSPPLGRNGNFPVCPVLVERNGFQAEDIVLRVTQAQQNCTVVLRGMTTWPQNPHFNGNSVCRALIDPALAVCGTPTPPCPNPDPEALTVNEEYSVALPFAIDAVRGAPVTFSGGGLPSITLSSNDIFFSHAATVGPNEAIRRISAGRLGLPNPPGYKPCGYNTEDLIIELAATTKKVWGLALGDFNGAGVRAVYMIVEPTSGSRKVQKLAFNRSVTDFYALPSGNTARSITFDPIPGDIFVTEDIEAGASNKARIWRIDENGTAVSIGRWFHKPNGITFHPSGVMLVTEESIDGLSGRVLAVGGWRNKFKRGNANGDGSVDIADASAISNWLLSMDPEDLPACLDAADADDSGEIDGQDANRIVQFLYNGGPPPAAPGPFSCGRDPTPDLMDCIVSAGCAIQ